jgi:hypothetical protein
MSETNIQINWTNGFVTFILVSDTASQKEIDEFIAILKTKPNCIVVRESFIKSIHSIDGRSEEHYV